MLFVSSCLGYFVIVTERKLTMSPSRAKFSARAARRREGTDSVGGGANYSLLRFIGASDEVQTQLLPDVSEAAMTWEEERVSSSILLTARLDPLERGSPR